MSIKAKIEAIIYAAEEPVTFEQIFALVKEEVRQELAQARWASRRAMETAREEAGVVVPEDGQLPPQQAKTGLAGDPVSVSAAERAPDSEWSVGQNEWPTEAQGNVPQNGAADAAAGPIGTHKGPAGPSLHSGQAPLDAGAPLSTENAPEPGPASSGLALAPEVFPGLEAAGAPTPASQSRACWGPQEAEPGTITDAELRHAIRAALSEVTVLYSSSEHGIEVRQIAGGYRMATKPEQHDLVRAFAKSLKPPIRLSLPALETLAVIAYKQPITAPEIGEIRGVDAGGVLGTLLDRKLITTGGRKQVVGRPILYKTTKEFLLRFGLNGLEELPSMEEFEKLAMESLGTDLFIAPAPEQPAEPPAATTSETASEQQPDSKSGEKSEDREEQEPEDDRGDPAVFS